FAEGGGEMRDRGVGADDEVEVLDDGGGIVEVADRAAWPLDAAGSLEKCPVLSSQLLLNQDQAPELAQRSEVAQGRGAVVVVRKALSAGARDADARHLPRRAQPVGPGRDAGGLRLEISRRRRNGVQFRAERERQAQERSLVIGLRNLVALRD